MGDRRLRVFVSHSSHTPEERDRLEAIVSGLGAGEDGVEVLYDKAQITGGAHWREVISTLLWECDAAVILLTPAARDSGWVLKEATNLSARHDMDAGFKLLVWASVGRDGLKDDERWNPLNLTDLQFVSGHSAAEIAGSVKQALAPLTAERRLTPLDLLAAQIVGGLKGAEEAQLQSVLDSLHERIPFEVGDQHRRLAYGIARWMLRQPPPALNRLADSLMDLGEAFPKNHALMIIDLVAPLWVDPETASWFVRARWQDSSCRDVAITCKEPTTTVRHCIARAHMPKRSPLYFPLNGITAGAHIDDVAREMRTLFAARLKRELGPRPEDDAIDRQINRITRRIYIVLGMPDDLEVAKALQTRYPHVTFVFHTPPERLPDAARSVADGVVWVRPALEPETEREMCDDYFNATITFRGGDKESAGELQ